MAGKVKEDISALSRKLIEDARAGVFKPVYVLMGDEPYYPDLVCQAILDNCIDDFGKDFNECTDKFEEAKIFDGKTIYDVEDEIEVLFG